MPAATELNERERELVRKHLERARKDLFHEIHKTGDHAFRDALMRERDQIEGILAKLGFTIAPS